MTISLQFKHIMAVCSLAGMAMTLSGCYVMPVEYRNTPAHTSATSAPVTPSVVTFPARLYPSNAKAASYGTVNATVTNDLHGRGVFTTTINGEIFTGEATRKSGYSNQGLANGTGNKGSYLTCTYQMNSSTQGTGQCTLSDQAEFTMHIGN